MIVVGFLGNCCCGECSPDLGKEDSESSIVHTWPTTLHSPVESTVNVSPLRENQRVVFSGTLSSMVPMRWNPPVPSRPLEYWAYAYFSAELDGIAIGRSAGAQEVRKISCEYIRGRNNAGSWFIQLRRTVAFGTLVLGATLVGSVNTFSSGTLINPDQFFISNYLLGNWSIQIDRLPLVAVGDPSIYDEPLVSVPASWAILNSAGALTTWRPVGTGEETLRWQQPGRDSRFCDWAGIMQTGGWPSPIGFTNAPIGPPDHAGSCTMANVSIVATP